MGREEIQDRTRKVSCLVCWLTYIFAFIAIAVVFTFPIVKSDYWNGFLAHIISTVVIFAFSLIFGNSSLYDPAWYLLPVGLAAGWMATGD